MAAVFETKKIKIASRGRPGAKTKIGIHRLFVLSFRARAPKQFPRAGAAAAAVGPGWPVGARSRAGGKSHTKIWPNAARFELFWVKSGDFPRKSRGNRRKKDRGMKGETPTLIRVVGKIAAVISPSVPESAGVLDFSAGDPGRIVWICDLTVVDLRFNCAVSQLCWFL